MPSDEFDPRLLLWDVDHTLIETRGMGLAIYRRAFLAATGRRLRELAEVSGRTELAIMRDTLRTNGLEPTDEAVEALAAALVQGYEDARAELASQGRALPGARDTLAATVGDPAVCQTVLTGNLRAVARIKLEVFGLDRFLDLDAGAYGDDHHDRATLVSLAQRRAGRRAGTTFTDSGTILIGDTPNDVAAGLRAGVRVIGVATGKTGQEELRRAGATSTVDDLRQARAVIGSMIARPDRA